MKDKQDCTLIGVPVEEGLSQGGCLMGPDAYRTAGLQRALVSLGHAVDDLGNVERGPVKETAHPNAAIKNLGTIAAWTRKLQDIVFAVCETGRFPLVLGGDHSLAMGTLSGLSRYAASIDRPLFVLWLDAHADIHTLDTTESGHLHGVPIAYAIGEPGFDDYLPVNPAPIDPAAICMMGTRSVDPAERSALARHPIEVHDMRALDEHGVVAPTRAFLERVRVAKGLLHVSLDVDFLDPDIAPGVNTTVPGGATFREAHLIMELLHDSGLVTSLDLVELNPFLDDRGRTANLMADLAASLMGRKVLDRPTRSF